MVDVAADVVISGAGPNGLMLACELALAGIRPVVLDKLSGPSAEPKANGLVGQVVRMLDMRGLYQSFSGDDSPPQPAQGWMFAAMPLSFLGLNDNSLYTMLMPQPRLVRLLEQRASALGVDLRWGDELTGFRCDSQSVVAEVSSPQRSYEISSRYLIGADGGRSLVRKTLGIEFPGCTSATVGRLAHVQLPDEFRTADRAVEIPEFGRLPFGHSRFDRGGVIFAEFEPGRSMLGTIEFGPPVEERPMSLAELRESVQRVLGVDIPLKRPKGPGPHALRRINGQNTRHAERYRRGRVLLLGDAAHVHSPMGGPGLNLGLQDTFNLGWKLAAELNGWAPDGLLDTYESERHPVGARVMMHSLAQTALMPPGPEVGALRELFGELLTIPEVTKQMGALLAGSDLIYPVGDEHPLSGRLVPVLTTDDGRRIDELMCGARPLLIDLADGDAAAAAQGWADRVEIVHTSIADRPAAAMLIRPDGYVAWAANAFDTGARGSLRDALQRWFGSLPGRLTSARRRRSPRPSRQGRPRPSKRLLASIAMSAAAAKLSIATPVVTLLPGVSAPWEKTASIEDLTQIAETADKLGYYHLTCSEHIALPATEKRRRGTRYWDPLATLGYLAARTQRIRLATNVLVLGYHHPLEIAKRYDTLDTVSNGRLILGVGVGVGVGVGSLKEEFDLIGAPFENRGARADDALRALRAALSVPEPRYHGEFYSFRDMVVDPCAVQKRLPIWVGGRTLRSLRRATSLAEGWVPFGISLGEARDWLSRFDIGSGFEVVLSSPEPLNPIGDPERTRHLLADLAAHGATAICATFAHSSRQQYLDNLHALAELDSP